MMLLALGKVMPRDVYEVFKDGMEEFRKSVGEINHHGGGMFSAYMWSEVNFQRIRTEMNALLAGEGMHHIWELMKTPVELGRFLTAKYEQKFGEQFEFIGRVAIHKKRKKYYQSLRRDSGGNIVESTDPSVGPRVYTDYEATSLAAFDARDALDFAVMGAKMREINDFVLFASASTRSISMLFEVMYDKDGNFDPAAAAMFMQRFGGYVVLPSVMTAGIAIMFGDQEEYFNLPQWKRDMYWNFHIGNGEFISIPKPFELGVMGSGVERALTGMFGFEENSFDGYGNSIMNGMLPIDVSAGVLLDGLIGPMLNFDTFFRGPISRETELHPDLRSKNSSVIAQMISDAFPFYDPDPKIIEALISKNLGGSQ